MAIGVSYIGWDGRKAEFSTEGNPEAGSPLDRIVRGGNQRADLSPMSELMRRGKRPGAAPDTRVEKAAGTVKLDEYDSAPGTLKSKLAREGSVTSGTSGLCLKGEENGVAKDGIYARRNGVPGFYTMDELDPLDAKGVKIGANGGVSSEDPNTESSDGIEGAYSFTVSTRTVMVRDANTGATRLVNFTRDIGVSGGNRVSFVGREEGHAS